MISVRVNRDGLTLEMKLGPSGFIFPISLESSIFDASFVTLAWSSYLPPLDKETG